MATEAEQAPRDVVVSKRLQSLMWHKNPKQNANAEKPDVIFLPFIPTQQELAAIWEWLNGQSE